MKLAIIIPVHNQIELTQRLLNQLLLTEAAGVETIIVDDASDENTRLQLIEHVRKHNNFSYLRNDRQQLFTRTVNRGIRAAQPDNQAYLLLNTDCEVKPGWLTKLHNVIVDDPNVAIVGYQDGVPPKGEGIVEVIYPPVGEKPTYITGHCILISKNALDVVGLFNETDLSQAHIASERMWCENASGIHKYRMYYVEGDEVIHNEGGPSWKRDLNWLHRFNYSQLWKGKNTW